MAKKLWFKPGIKTGWSKEDPITTRRRRVLKAHKGDYLSSGRSMQALANVTQDKQTATCAGIDARYFFRKNKEK